MDSDDDFELFAPSDQPSPAPERKLKRLKKSVKPLTNPSSIASPSTTQPDLSTPHSPTLEKSNDDQFGSEGLEEDNQFNSVSGGSDAESENSEGFGNESDELGSGFDGGEENGAKAKRVLDFDTVREEEDDGNEEERIGETEDENMELSEESPEKEQCSFEELGCEETNKVNKKKRKKRDKSTKDGEQWKAIGSTVKMTAKERREHLNQLHAESQRLLRETRDASFRPVPLVQKSISSVLEKIRKRKMEISKKEARVDSDPEDPPSFEQEDARTDEVVVTETIVKHVETKTILEPFDVLPMDGLNESATHSSHDDIPSQMDEDKEVKQQAFRAPIDDTQELFSESQDSDTSKQPSNELPNSPLEEVLGPSLLAMNLKLDSAPPDEVSDFEEENDKENMHPHLHKQTELPSSPKGVPVKAFLDDEAEEEDDSDNDQLLFQENEEDEDSEDLEELNDMIATGFKEQPIDNEVRNQLHQKWLEQQDAMGTENLMQRLKYGSKEPEAHLLQEDSDDADDKSEEDEDIDDEAEEDLAPKDLIRATIKKVKQMIPLMFTDKEDPYVSSDDEETEKWLAKQVLHEKTEEKATFLSPAEDAGSKEVFGLIKKTNVLHDSKRKVKSSTPFGMPLVGGNKTRSSKSSFIGREGSYSMPSSHKLGSKVRSFIFGREDSSSKTSISEDSSDAIEREKVPSSRAPAKFSGSQSKYSSQRQNTETNSNQSLFEILRRSSLQSNKRTESTTSSQDESIFASFRLPKKPVK